MDPRHHQTFDPGRPGKYDPKNPEFWKQIELPNGADEIYVCIGVKASNYFMPAETLSDKGPGGGGWIHFNKHLQVTQTPGEIGWSVIQSW